ncbi:hypothetical protein AX774_g704 [Zancudomyces culisetae]|uniref:Uncharacterized protein n=1 Tax=Zancudomyces culisetae TaxID=1213189 RepID=A0A1R1PXS7_ZANCU|nr:hypothetical protein AX774_g704 [Zancudomyces culisetae]|eukprot:OMH85739.1 hypothetical protein AX774_g704 [Zancudomyces culisetae]
MLASLLQTVPDPRYLLLLALQEYIDFVVHYLFLPGFGYYPFWAVSGYVFFGCTSSYTVSIFAFLYRSVMICATSITDSVDCWKFCKRFHDINSCSFV